MDQENDGLQDVREEFVDSEDEEESDEERDFRWHEQVELNWSEDDEAELESMSDTPAERSGHIAVVDTNCMYVWGGYKNAEAPAFFDLYLPRHEIWIYNMETARWRRQLSRGDLPSPMSGSCGACVEGNLYLLEAIMLEEILIWLVKNEKRGMHSLEVCPFCATVVAQLAAQQRRTHRVYRLPLRAADFHWDRMKNLKGLAPTCKDKLGCWVYTNRLVYFGGYGYVAEADHRGMFELDENSLMGNHQGRGWNNHIHILNLENAAWSQPITKGNAPTPRAAHACATLGNRGYTFGGRYMDHRLNDLYYINMDTWEWTEITSLGQYLSTVQLGSWHSFIPVSSDHIFLFGGFTTNRETLSDAWLYCVTSNEWKQFKHNHKKNPRLWHTACSGLDGDVIVFGGCANNLLSHQQASHSNELLIFTVQPKSLLRCCTEVIVQHRHQLESMFDCLPKHLLHRLQQRFGSATTGGS